MFLTCLRGFGCGKMGAFLVPVSIGFLGFQALVEQKTMAGMQSAFQVVFVSAALVSGLLMANVLVHSRRWTVPTVSATLPKTVGQEPFGEAAACLDRQD